MPSLISATLAIGANLLLGCSSDPTANQNAPAEQAAPDAAPAVLLDGIWQGHIGAEPVMACFGERAGSFYRLSDKKLVSLWSENALQFAENDERDSRNPRWRIVTVAAQELAGQRRGSDAARPLRLRRVPFRGRTDDSEMPETPCRSLAYHRHRLGPLRITRQPARVGAIQIDQIRATRLGGADVEYRTFELRGREPGVLAVNRLLARLIDRRGAGESEWSQCLIGAGNSEGLFQLILEPVRIGESFLVAHEHHDNSCGGNHPNTATFPRIYDLSRGRELRIREWLSSRALDQVSWAMFSPEESEPNALPLSLALRRELLRRLPRPEGDCAGVIEGTDFWTVGVGRDGFLFSPQVAHVARACGDQVEVPFSAMRKYLNADGRRAARVLASERVTIALP